MNKLELQKPTTQSTDRQVGVNLWKHLSSLRQNKVYNFFSGKSLTDVYASESAKSWKRICKIKKDT